MCQVVMMIPYSNVYSNEQHELHIVDIQAET